MIRRNRFRAAQSARNSLRLPRKMSARHFVATAHPGMTTFGAPMDSLPIANAEVTRFFHAWLETFAGYVREVDYASARPLFHPDVLAFGTHNDVIPGIEQWIATQWDKVWPKTSDFRFTLEQTSGVGIARWPDGDRDRAVDQHGLSRRRKTVSAAGTRDHGVFKERRWLAVHAFAHVAQSRCAADQPRQSAGEGVVIRVMLAPSFRGARSEITLRLPRRRLVSRLSLRPSWKLSQRPLFSSERDRLLPRRRQNFLA